MVSSDSRSQRRRFLLRIAFPVMGFGMGLLQLLPWIEGQFGWQGFLDQKVNSLWRVPPQVCWPGHAINEFQMLQCHQYWIHLGQKFVLFGLPILGMILAFFLGLQTFLQLHRRFQKKVQTGHAAFLGTVLEIPRASSTLFGWFYGLVPVIIQPISHAEKVTLWIVSHGPYPQVGEQWVVFELTVWGQKHYLGKPYSPHIAIIRGSE